MTIAEYRAPGATIHNFEQGLWWSVVTVTTVGYGDKYPVTGFGQGVAIVLMFVGIGLIGVLTATVASYFVGQDLDKAEDERELIREELRQAREERDALIKRLDHMNEMMSEVLRRTNGRGDDLAHSDWEVSAQE